jgi:hypothetical protein
VYRSGLYERQRVCLVCRLIGEGRMIWGEAPGGGGKRGKYMSREAKISFASSAHASKARDSERTRVLSQSKRRVVIFLSHQS